MTSKPRLWVISELYYPEETSTGYFLTRIAEGLTSQFSVHVLCSRPTYSERQVAVSWRERRGGVNIRRMRSTRFHKDSFSGRVLNLVGFTLAITASCMGSLRRGDRVLVVTNPPTIPPIVGLIARLKRARAFLLVHDVYPEVLVAAGIIDKGRPAARLLGCLTAMTYRFYEKVIVLGRDMAAITRSRLPGREARVTIITNWADLDEVRPLEFAQNPFARMHNAGCGTVIQFSGNIGRTHDVESILATARELVDRNDIRFQFVGTGGKAKLVRESDAILPNIMYLPRQPRALLGPMLAAADAVVIPFVDRMLGVSVPSRMYNVMAAGTPIVAMAHPDSELARVVVEESCGWVVSPGDVQGLAAVAREIASEEGRLEAQRRGMRGRAAAVRRYSLSHILEQFTVLLSAEPGTLLPTSYADDHDNVHARP